MRALSEFTFHVASFIGSRSLASVPEGDTIHSAARRVGDALVGKPIVSIETPQPATRWIAGPSVSTDAPCGPWTHAASTCSSASRAT